MKRELGPMFDRMFPPDYILDGHEAQGAWVIATEEALLENCQSLYVGGLWYHFGNFVRFGMNHTMPGYYILPSRPLIKDIPRLIGIKLFGNSDPLAKVLAESVIRANKTFTIYALSQGCLATVNAIKQYGMSNTHEFVFFSPAVSYWTARRFIPKNRLHYYIPWNDAASIWAPSCNPLKFLSGFVDLTRMCHNHRVRGLEFHWQRFHESVESKPS